MFILKYGDRQELIPNYILLITYNLFIIIGITIINKFNNRLKRFSGFNLTFIIISIIVLGCFFVINILIDSETLNVDRWSALEGFIRSVLEGKYPYNIKDHLGQTSSNLPGLFYLGLPFYFLGDIGFLQCVVFALLMFCIYKSSLENHVKTILVFLLLLSPAYLWEISVKSDLMSNLFLVVIFISFWKKKFPNISFSKPVLLSFFCAFFALTRGIVLIPLIIFLFKDFIKTDVKIKVYFLVGLLVFSFLISLPVLVLIPNYETLVVHNPFNHQVRYAPIILIIMSLLVPFLFSFKVKNNGDVFYHSFLIITLLMFITFTINLYEEGFTANIYGDVFDLSYLGMIIPFVIFYLLHTKNTMHA
ncbi:hypothetical protein OAD34_01535 [Flavobacteriaceae bacterium]|nr:hypothetical protein [Flavobacteriaceae bacterium]